MVLEGRSGRRWSRRLAASLSLVAILGAGAVNAEVPAAGKMNLNTATAEELTTLPGIGPARARAIVERRTEKPFASVDELRDVPGLGDSVVDKLKSQVEVSMSAAAGSDAATTAKAASGAGKK